MPSFFCAIPFCKAAQSKRISLFSAPDDDHDDDRRQKWIDFVKSESLRSGYCGYDNYLNYNESISQLQRGNHFHICSQHFCDDDIINKTMRTCFDSELKLRILSSTAVPSVMVPLLPEGGGGNNTTSYDMACI